MIEGSVRFNAGCRRMIEGSVRFNGGCRRMIDGSAMQDSGGDSGRKDHFFLMER